MNNPQIHFIQLERLNLNVMVTRAMKLKNWPTIQPTIRPIPIYQTLYLQIESIQLSSGWIGICMKIRL